MWSWVKQLGKALNLRGHHGFEGAARDRTTSDHFPHAESSINLDLVNDLRTLRTRTLYEVKNNPFLAGVVETHKIDVVGPHGPSLQLTTDNDHFNSEVEEAWEDWWQSPDISGALSGPELLQQNIGMLWGCGEFLQQMTIDNEADTEIQFRLSNIHPRRLDDPLGSGFDNSIVMGVRRNKYGKPTGYFVTDFNVDEGFVPLSYNQREIAASEIIHGFRQMEPGQVRGYPLAAPCLSVVANLRDYDASVLRAARMVAEMSVLLYTDHPDVTPLMVNESVEFEPNVLRTVVPGWKPLQVKAEQPATNYVEFRTERLRELGRPVNMPLMMVRLDSREHNYSSARFDGQVYNRGVKTIQAWLSRKLLNRCLSEVITEASLVRGLRKPKKINWSWTWPVSPHVDPQKEANAIKLLLEMGLISEFQAAAMVGNDYEDVVEQRLHAQQVREQKGINQEETESDRNSRIVRAVVDILSSKEGVEIVRGGLAV